MKKLLPLTFTILTSTYVSTVNAENNWYLGALYSKQEFSMQGRDFNTAGVIAGYQYNKYFALETRLSTGTSGYAFSYEYEGIPVEYNEDIDQQASLLLKASYPLIELLNQSFSIYGLAGYTKSTVEINGVSQTYDESGNTTGSSPFTITETDNGFSYGIGLNYQMNDQFSIFIDYQVLPNYEPSPNYSKSWKSSSIGINFSF